MSKTKQLSSSTDPKAREQPRFEMHVCYPSTVPPPNASSSAKNKRTIPPLEALRVSSGVRTCAFHRWGRVRYAYASTHYNNNNNTIVTTPTVDTTFATYISHSSAPVGRVASIFICAFSSVNDCDVYFIQKYFSHSVSDRLTPFGHGILFRPLCPPVRGELTAFFPR